MTSIETSANNAIILEGLRLTTNPTNVTETDSNQTEESQVTETANSKILIAYTTWLKEIKVID